MQKKQLEDLESGRFSNLLSSKRLIIKRLMQSSIFRITWKKNVSSKKERFWGLYLFHFSGFCAFFWGSHALLYVWEWIWSNKEIQNSGWNKTVSWGKWKLSGTESPFFCGFFPHSFPLFLTLCFWHENDKWLIIRRSSCLAHFLARILW